MWKIGGSILNYNVWVSLRKGDRVKNFTYGKGTIVSDIGVGYVVKFDNGTIKRITDGSLEKCQ